MVWMWEPCRSTVPFPTDSCGSTNMARIGERYPLSVNNRGGT